MSRMSALQDDDAWLNAQGLPGRGRRSMGLAVGMTIRVREHCIHEMAPDSRSGSTVKEWGEQ